MRELEDLVRGNVSGRLGKILNDLLPLKWRPHFYNYFFVNRNLQNMQENLRLRRILEDVFIDYEAAKHCNESVLYTGNFALTQLNS